MIVGVAGTVKLEMIVTAMVLAAASLPLAEVVKPTVQVEEALAAAEAGEKETAVGVVAPSIATLKPGLAAVVS